MNIVVVVPTYNEAETIVPLLQVLLALPLPLRVLVVDDRSPDGTADRAAAGGDRVTVLRRDPPRGRGLAGRDGFIAALAMGADLVVEMDADGSHDPRQLPALIAAAADADIVSGSRYCPGGRVVGYDWLRKLNSAVANAVSRLLLGLTPRDATSGYRVFRRRVLEAIDLPTLLSPGPSIVEEILFRAQRRGFVAREVPITFVNRAQGESKLRPATVVVWLRTLLRVRRRGF